MMRTAEPQVTILWIKEVEEAKSIDELVTSRSIAGQHNFPDFDMLECDDCVSLEEGHQHAVNFPSKSRKLKIPTDSYEGDKLRT